VAISDRCYSHDVTTPRTPATPRRSTRKPKVATPSELQAVWSGRKPERDAWTPRPWVPVEDRAAFGRSVRQKAPRSSQGIFEPAAGRDPVGIVLGQEADRLPDLLPLRHARMAESPFAFYRGAAAVMAFDLSTTPRTGIMVQACGDAHLSNFGLFASPERELVFDANDFDETLPAPWEWDVKRLAASMVIACRANGFNAGAARAVTMRTVRAYREQMARYAGMRLLDIWYDQTTAEDIERQMFEDGRAADVKFAVKDARQRLNTFFAKTRGKDQLKATASLTAIVDGEWRIKDDPPVVTHVETPGGPMALEKTFSEYRASLAENRRELVERYRFVDFALKVVGVGSVGTRCFVVLLEGRDRDDALILQAKEATASVLDPYVASSHHMNSGERVVVGQRLMQATPDIFLGWTRGPGGRDFYFRQLWDMKGSVDTASLRTPGMIFYGMLCARTLARAHARSGDSIAIAAYLGTSDTLDGAIADFAEAYADQNDRDHAAFTAAIAAGRLAVAEHV
jgi:uncharacterized protein (DUF2252 family)